MYEILFVNQQLQNRATGRNFEVMVDQFNADKICINICNNVITDPENSTA